MNTDIFESGLERRSARDRLNKLLGPEVIQDLHKRSDSWGWYGIISCWAAIALALFFAHVALQSSSWWSAPLLLLSVFIIGGRILGLAILTHEGSHRSLFATPSLNDGLTNWICGAPVYLDIVKYRRHHAQHHVHTGTDNDVDLPLIEGFPTTRSSMIRKLFRDISGQTGLKSLVGFALMNAGAIKWNVSGIVEKTESDSRSRLDYAKTFFQESKATLIFHTLFFILMFSLSLTELFFIWWASYLFVYPFCLRIRAIAEHAATEKTPDMLRNTRTTKAGYISRALFAPFNVNYHIEHHTLVSVPYWQLPKLHKLLIEKEAVPNPPNYWQVIKLAASSI